MNITRKETELELEVQRLEHRHRNDECACRMMAEMIKELEAQNALFAVELERARGKMNLSEIYREIARVIEMPPDNWWECVRVNGCIGRDRRIILNPNPANTWEFAICIVDGKPVFPGDKLFGGSK